MDDFTRKTPTMEVPEARETEGENRAAVSRLVPITVADLLAMELPIRPALLAPVIPSPGLVMLYAPRGVGKTFVALSIAHAVATGGAVLRWHAPEPRNVLYIDGEMPAPALQARIRKIATGADDDTALLHRLRFLAADLLKDGLPNLAHEDAQRAVTEAAEDADLIILDNLSSLASGLRENEADDWSTVQRWLLRLRRAGKSVLLIHHAGKGGQQRGTSRREDVLDTVISLRRPQDYSAQDGARFEVHLEKARAIVGAETRPFEATLGEGPDGRLAWSVRDLPTGARPDVASMLKTGASVRQIAEATGLSKSTVGRMRQSTRGDRDAMTS